MVKEEMLEMGEELKHSTFEERRDINVKDVFNVESSNVPLQMLL